MATDPSPARDQLLQALCTYVLENGLSGATLRPMAKAAGTSDRMLIYHFGTKERLLDAVLDRLAEDLERELACRMPAEHGRSLEALVAEIMALLRSEGMRRTMRVWLEVVAAAGFGHAGFRATGARVLERFLPWLEARLPEDVTDRAATAAALLALIEGCIVMDAVGLAPTADLAARRLVGPAPKA
jgi:AcrR family transcriptional regulator